MAGSIGFYAGNGYGWIIGALSVIAFLACVAVGYGRT
jgi:hypothetical protein